MTIGIAVGALLAARIAGTAVAGLAQSAAVVGRGAARRPGHPDHERARPPAGAGPGLPGRRGRRACWSCWPRRPTRCRCSSSACSSSAAGTAANLQARYTAVDLAEPARRGRQLSLIVWATTIGAVAGAELRPARRPHRSQRVRPAACWPARSRSARLAFVLAAVVLLVLLRPDPLLTARRLAAAEAPVARRAVGRRRRRTRSRRRPGATRPACGHAAAWQVVRVRPAARLGIAAVAVGHLVMVGGDGDDAGAPRRVRRTRDDAADRRHRAEPAHRRHVRASPGGRLAHRPARAGGR